MKKIKFIFRLCLLMVTISSCANIANKKVAKKELLQITNLFKKECNSLHIKYFKFLISNVKLIGNENFSNNFFKEIQKLDHQKLFEEFSLKFNNIHKENKIDIYDFINASNSSKDNERYIEFFDNEYNWLFFKDLQQKISYIKHIRNKLKFAMKNFDEQVKKYGKIKELDITLPSYLEFDPNQPKIKIIKRNFYLAVKNFIRTNCLQLPKYLIDIIVKYCCAYKNVILVYGSSTKEKQYINHVTNISSYLKNQSNVILNVFYHSFYKDGVFLMESIKNSLSLESNVDNFIIILTAGVLHGAGDNTIFRKECLLDIDINVNLSIIDFSAIRCNGKHATYESHRQIFMPLTYFPIYLIEQNEVLKILQKIIFLNCSSTYKQSVE